MGESEGYYFEIGRLASVYIGIGTGVRLVLALGAVFIAVALPRLRNAPAGLAAEVVLRAVALRAVHRLVRSAD